MQNCPLDESTPWTIHDYISSFPSYMRSGVSVKLGVGYTDPVSIFCPRTTIKALTDSAHLLYSVCVNNLHSRSLAAKLHEVHEDIYAEAQRHFCII